MVVLLIGTVWLALSLLAAASFVAVVRGGGGAVASGTGEPRHIDVPAPRAAEQPVRQKAGAGP